MKQNYSENVKRGGLKYLLDKWEWICSRVPYDNLKWQFDEYLNDISTREIINVIIKNCDDIHEDSLIRLEKIDNIFRNKTIEVNQCIWGLEIEKKHGYTKESNWMSYRLPPERIADWFPGPKMREQGQRGVHGNAGAPGTNFSICHFDIPNKKGI
jgi:hypothetical protein